MFTLFIKCKRTFLLLYRPALCATASQLMLHYKISDYSDVQEFVALLAQRLGRLKKGGRPDVNKAAKIVLQDWNRFEISSSS